MKAVSDDKAELRETSSPGMSDFMKYRIISSIGGLTLVILAFATGNAWLLGIDEDPAVKPKAARREEAPRVAGPPSEGVLAGEFEIDKLQPTGRFFVVSPKLSPAATKSAMTPIEWPPAIDLEAKLPQQITSVSRRINAQERLRTSTPRPRPELPPSVRIDPLAVGGIAAKPSYPYKPSRPAAQELPGKLLESPSSLTRLPYPGFAVVDAEHYHWVSRGRSASGSSQLTVIWGRVSRTGGSEDRLEVTLPLDRSDYSITHRSRVSPDGQQLAVEFRRRTSSQPLNALLVVIDRSGEYRGMWEAEQSHISDFCWSSARQLVVLQNGRLSGWDPASDISRAEVEEEAVAVPERAGPATSAWTLDTAYFCLARHWPATRMPFIAVGGAGYVDLIHPETGAVEKRYPLPGEFAVEHIAVNPSYNVIALWTTGNAAVSRTTRPLDPAKQPGLFLIRPSIGVLHQVDTNRHYHGQWHYFLDEWRLCTSGKRYRTILDFERRGRTTATMTQEVQVTPDGAFWDGSHLLGQRYVLEGASLADLVFQLRVDVCGAKWSKHYGDRIAAGLTSYGARIGASSWKIQVSGAAELSSQTFTSDNGENFNQPQLRLTWKVLNPAGKIVVERKQLAAFPLTTSKYYQGPATRDGVPPATGKGHWKFTGDPQSQLLEEMMQYPSWIKTIPLRDAFKQESITRLKKLEERTQKSN